MEVPFMSKTLAYGPERPSVNHDYTQFTTPTYLRGYSKKILKDLTKAARMYNGKLLRVFQEMAGERCPECTNSITGEVLSSNCKRCNGTGKVNCWNALGSYWSYVDLGPNYRMSMETGNTENPGGVKEQFIILGAPLLKDQDFVVVVETREIFKLFNVEPFIIAMRGDVIAQTASCSSLAAGSPQYGVIDW